MIRAKNYETVSKFVKVMTKILWPLFFPDMVQQLQLTRLNHDIATFASVLCTMTSSTLADSQRRHQRLQQLHTHCAWCIHMSQTTFYLQYLLTNLHVLSAIHKVNQWPRRRLHQPPFQLHLICYSSSPKCYRRDFELLISIFLKRN